jgi:hypothetical protein
MGMRKNERPALAYYAQPQQGQRQGILWHNQNKSQGYGIGHFWLKEHRSLYNPYQNHVQLSKMEKALRSRRS